LPASLPDYQLDDAYIAKNYDIEDVTKAQQLLAASGFDLEREYELLGRNPGSTEEAGALVWQQQLMRGGIKTRIVTVAGFGQLAQKWTDNAWELMVQAGNGNDTPSQALRNQHSKGWSDAFRRFALMDPEIDALIEQSDTTLDFEENVKIVKQAQELAIQRFTSFYNIQTPNITNLLRDRVQHWEITLIDNHGRVDFWLKDT
jgi:ABC-type transport system substrate-binding protein